MKNPMKIAIIAPPYPLSEFPAPPLGVCYVAAACEAAGARVKVLDYIVSRYTPEKFKRELDAFQPDIVGATSVTLNFPDAAEIIKTAKQHNPSLITMMGGPHVSFDPENTLRKYPELDIIFIGEAEETLKEWLPAARNRSAWQDIKGLAFLENGAFVTTGPGEHVQDLDTLPLPARHLLPLSKYQAMGFPISIITSRGCPNKCIFCLGRRIVGFKVRHRSPARVADEVESILAYGFERINIADDLFTANKKRVRAFCEEIRGRNLKFAWSAFSRVDTIDEETLKLMKEAGCDAVSFGIESGNPEMLKRVKKGITLDQARKAVGLCKKVGMVAHASFIVGLPGESPATLNDTLNFARELQIPHGYHFLSPFPGTTVRENVSEYDLEILTDDWRLYDANQAIVRTSSLAPEQMNAFVETAYRPVNDEWEEIKRRCAQGLCDENERMKVDGEKRMHLIFEILSQDLIETEGAFDTNGHDPIAELSAKVARKNGWDEAFVQWNIRYWKDKNYLAYSQNNGQTRWFWTPNRTFAPCFSPSAPIRTL